MIMVIYIYVLSISGALLPEKIWMKILLGFGVWIIGTALIFVLEASE